MPELTVILVAIMAIATVIGTIIGWVFRGKRAEQEKAAVTAEWQDQIDAQRRESDRLLEQNKGLMNRSVNSRHRTQTPRIAQRNSP